jgi:predicted Zn-dependent protease
MTGEPDNLGRMAAPGRGRRFPIALMAGLLMAGFALVLAACAPIDPPPTPISVLPPAAPRAASSEKANPERRRLIAAFGGVYTAPATQAYLDGVLMKLAPPSNGAGPAYRLTVLNSPIVNAFSLPSGDIFITRGLLALADDTAEIAAVMGHEIGHITARHAAQRAEFEKTTALFSRVNSQVLGEREAQDEVDARSKLAIARFSREQEFAADQIGIRTIARAGYDPYAAARFLTALGEWSAFRAQVSGAGSANRPDMMATHPSTPERIAEANAAARQYGPPGTGETGRNAYLAAIDGLAFGDDPSQGVVRGEAFVHPKLGFAFDAPDGFTLDNQPAALIGVGQGGGEALRLDSIVIPESTPVTAAIGSDWIDGVKTTAIEARTIGGLEGATAVAKGDQWSFRLGAVRLNTRLYRLIYAAHDLSPAVDSRFMASLDSFRPLTPQDLALAAPEKIKIVEAATGDTAETLAARMGFLPQWLDQFLILNGLERGADLVPGQRYKIVVR